MRFRVQFEQEPINDTKGSDAQTKSQHFAPILSTAMLVAAS